MRKNLDSSRGFIRLSDELDQINSYLAIEKARFGERIQVRLDIEDGCQDWPIPSLIIQPLVENAVKHGLKERSGAGIVGLKIHSSHNQLHVAVYDDGTGIPDNILCSLLEKRQIESHSEGIGLRNSNLRLEPYLRSRTQHADINHPQQGNPYQLLDSKPQGTAAQSLLSHHARPSGPRDSPFLPKPPNASQLRLNAFQPPETPSQSLSLGALHFIN